MHTACAPQPRVAAGGSAQFRGPPGQGRLSPRVIPIGTLGEGVTLKGSRSFPWRSGPCSPYAQQSSHYTSGSRLFAGSANEKRGLRPRLNPDFRSGCHYTTDTPTWGMGSSPWRARLPWGFFKQGHTGQSSGSRRRLCANAAVLHVDVLAGELDKPV